jgi:hypothetical protein
LTALFIELSKAFIGSIPYLQLIFGFPDFNCSKISNFSAYYSHPTNDSPFQRYNIITMKLTSITLTTLAAVSSVNGISLPESNDPSTIAAASTYCARPDAPCGQFKRAADAALPILIELETHHERNHSHMAEEKDCWKEGGHCTKAKRAALALEEAIHEASNYENLPDDHFDKRSADALFCWMRGKGCGRAKREAEPSPLFCWMRGKGCGKAKREAEAELAADPPFCWMRSKGCGKVKRAADAINKIAAEGPGQFAKRDAAALFCWMRGKGCGKAKRALDHLAILAREAVNYLNEE